MPDGDGTGPSGRGPMTGRGFGRCGDSGVNRGVGRGNGRGHGAGTSWVLGAGVIASIVTAALAETDKQRKTKAAE